MTAFHVVLGVTVLALNLLVGVAAFARSDTERFRGVAVGAHLALGVQVAAGFLLFNSGGPGPAHALLPVAALAAVVGIRVGRGEAHPREVLAVSWVAVAAAAFGFASGLA